MSYANSQRRFAHEMLLDLKAEITPNMVTAQRAVAQDNDLRALNAELVEALLSMLNLESDAAYGAHRRAEANPTHEAMDVAYHCDKARAALAKANHD